MKFHLDGLVKFVLIKFQANLKALKKELQDIYCEQT